MMMLTCVLYFVLLVYVVNISTKAIHMLQQNLYNEKE